MKTLYRILLIFMAVLLAVGIYFICVGLWREAGMDMQPRIRFELRRSTPLFHVEGPPPAQEAAHV